MNIDTPINAQQPVIIDLEAYTSATYARAERDKLWRKVWQQACRVEEIPSVGDYVTYDILDDSILIVRTAPGQIKAYHNVCQHRGRRLVDTPRGANAACGKTKQFVCGFHGWRWNLDGENTHVLDRDDWQGALTDENIKLPQVKVDTWGGWVFVNMDPNCEPLRDYLEPAAGMLDPFAFEKMRFRWRRWFVIDANWKTCAETFMESYHVQGTHPKLAQHGDFYTWSQAFGKHGASGFAGRGSKPKVSEDNAFIRAGKGPDPRVATWKYQVEILDGVKSATTETIVNAAARLVDELPEGTPADRVMAHLLASARRDDAARGVDWPNVTPEHYAKTGGGWAIFPNLIMSHGYTFVLTFRIRPHASDPGKCIYESTALERYPEGEEPKTEWEYAGPTDERWGTVQLEDFSNIVAIQKGLTSAGFRGMIPNPQQEYVVTNFHRTLAKYMGTGAPRPFA